MSYHEVWVPHIEYEQWVNAHTRDEFMQYGDWLAMRLDEKMKDDLLSLAAVDGSLYILRPRGTA